LDTQIVKIKNAAVEKRSMGQEERKRFNWKEGLRKGKGEMSGLNINKQVLLKRSSVNTPLPRAIRIGG